MKITDYNAKIWTMRRNKRTYAKHERTSCTQPTSGGKRNNFFVVVVAAFFFYSKCIFTQPSIFVKCAKAREIKYIVKRFIFLFFFAAAANTCEREYPFVYKWMKCYAFVKYLIDFHTD